MKIIFCTALLALATAVVSAQGLTMVVKTTGSTRNVTTTYMSNNISRTTDSAYSFDVLTDYQKGITYVIDKKAKTITFTRTSDLPAFAAFMSAHMPKSKQMDAMNASMNNLYGDPAVFKIESVGKDTVIGRSCNKTRITSGNVVAEYCVDPSLKSPIDSAGLVRLAAAKSSGMQAYPRAAKVLSNLFIAAANLKGVILKSRTSGLRGDTLTEVTSITQGPIPAATFALPAGYAMKDQIAESEKAMASRGSR